MDYRALFDQGFKEISLLKLEVVHVVYLEYEV